MVAADRSRLLKERFVEHWSLVASFAAVSELTQRYSGFTVVGEEKSQYKMSWYRRDIVLTGHRSTSDPEDGEQSARLFNLGLNTELLRRSL